MSDPAAPGNAPGVSVSGGSSIPERAGRQIQLKMRGIFFSLRIPIFSFAGYAKEAGDRQPERSSDSSRAESSIGTPTLEQENSRRRNSYRTSTSVG